MGINILQKYRRINGILLLAAFVQVFLGQSIHILLEHKDAHQCKLEGGESHYHDDTLNHRHCAICHFKIDGLRLLESICLKPYNLVDTVLDPAKKSFHFQIQRYKSDVPRAPPVK